MKRIFLAGIIQGSLVESAIHCQDYRAQIKRVLAQCLPDARVYCPIEHHPASLGYGPDKGRQVFLHHIEMARDSDMVVAFLPSASMGTAIELWEAHRNGTPIVAISPLARNWVVKFLSDLIVPDMEAFERACRDGKIAGLLNRERIASPPRDPGRG